MFVVGTDRRRTVVVIAAEFKRRGTCRIFTEDRATVRRSHTAHVGAQRHEADDGMNSSLQHWQKFKPDIGVLSSRLHDMRFPGCHGSAGVAPTGRRVLFQYSIERSCRFSRVVIEETAESFASDDPA